MTTENKYLVKVCALLRAPEPPRSEKAVKRPRKIHPPKLKKFVSRIESYSKRPKTSY